MNIVLTGATGLIGKQLIPELEQAGHSLKILARTPGRVERDQVFKWSASESAPSDVLRGADALIHLAGENVASARWSPSRKGLLRASRVEGTNNLLEGVAKLSPAERPKILLAASAVGIYGSNTKKIFDESSPPGTDFLAQLCADWEKSAQAAQALGLRVVHLRFGLVLAREGGVLTKMGPVILGTGEQWMSWIHVSDVVSFILFALAREDLRGPVNVVSPHPVRQREFVKLLAKRRGFPLTFPIPAWALRLALGEMAEAVLASQNVRPTVAQTAGFSFRFPDLEKALEELVADKRRM